MLYRIYLHFLSYYVHTVLYTVFLFVIYDLVFLKQQLFAFAKSGIFFHLRTFELGSIKAGRTIGFCFNNLVDW